MFKYFFIIFAFWYHTYGQAFPQQDIIETLMENLPILLENGTDPADNSSEIPDACNKLIIKVNGNSNINTGKQIFNINIETKIAARVNIEGYLITPGIGAHKLHTDSLTWNDARHACIQEGGHLAVINSDSEEEVLLRMLRDNGIDTAWLGLHDLYKKSDWVTVTDKPLKNTGYTKWAAKPADGPDSDTNRQNCATLITEGGMGNEQCDVSVPFFCEISV